MLASTIASTWHLVTKRVAFSPHIWGSNDAAAGFLFGANRGNQPRVSRGARLRDLPDAAADEDRVASVCGHQQSKYHCLSVLRLWSDPRSQSTTRCDARLEIGQRQFFQLLLMSAAVGHSSSLCRRTGRAPGLQRLLPCPAQTIDLAFLNVKHRVRESPCANTV